MRHPRRWKRHTAAEALASTRLLRLYETCWVSLYLLKGLVELALLQQLQDVGLLGLVVQVCGGDGRPRRRPHGLHDAGGHHRLLLLHGEADLPFDDPLHLAQDRLLQTTARGRTLRTTVLIIITAHMSLIAAHFKD